MMPPGVRGGEILTAGHVDKAKGKVALGRSPPSGAPWRRREDQLLFVPPAPMSSAQTWNVTVAPAIAARLANVMYLAGNSSRRNDRRVPAAQRQRPHRFRRGRWRWCCPETERLPPLRVTAVELPRRPSAVVPLSKGLSRCCRGSAPVTFTLTELVFRIEPPP